MTMTVGELLGEDMKKIESDLGLSDNKILQSAKSIFEQLESLQEYWDNIREKQSQVDMAIMDVEHFIEISDNLNASEGYNSYKLLRELLRKRRELKETSLELSALIHSIAPQELCKKKHGTINSIKSRIANNNRDKIYRTRVLKDVFGEIIR